jgi:hypothetical protein
MPLRPDEIGALAATAKKNATQANEIIADLISQQRYLASILEESE